ncbi:MULTISPECIES: hypothetical protein [unclassified Polaromonas]|uniref:hypothetical protein n=1 Tax=unclassified Polaromonas TaxID=2638319 RepID=UPI0025E94C3B|nr:MULTISPECIES: hypothetical protein [unclassified Polaromonas]HQR98650.1 hypothetical protein [Polaromonas sp.]HQS41036.1 hypothetical protein [Polaromonas sp.]HQS86824.1 hypothetical protein [Polaromonas sp.]HQT09157.1 hypothetical protein [Polaromonas sp.]
MPSFTTPVLPDLKRVINAWGTPTPYGVSRSDPAVAEAGSLMLQRHVVLADLQALAGRELAAWSGAESACVTHCSAAAITLAVAACMAGTDAARVAQLPDNTGMPNRVLLLAAQQVNYGQAITQAVRLAGAHPVPCPALADLAADLARGGVACVLAVESHLAVGSGPAVTGELAALAHAAGVPLVLDAAAQDWRARELVTGGADLVLLSGQKYLRSPTAGLVLGRADLVAALDAQHGGVGRAMKPTKEALAGVLAALRLRADMPRDAWCAAQQRKLDAMAAAARGWPGVTVERTPDPQGNGFARLWLKVDAAVTGISAGGVIGLLRAGDPVVVVAPHRAAQGSIGLELTAVHGEELPELCALLATALNAG